MKKVICVVALACVVLVLGAKEQSCSSGDVCKCENTKKAETAILNVHDAMIAAAQKRDVETMFDYILDNDKGTIAQNGQLLSRQEAMEQIGQGMLGATEIKYDIKQRNIKMLSPKIGLMTASGTVTTTIETGESFTSQFANTSVYVLEKDGWKVIHGHHSMPVRN